MRTWEKKYSSVRNKEEYCRSSRDVSGPKLASGHWLMWSNFVRYFGTKTAVVAGCVSYGASSLTCQMLGWLNRRRDERRSFWPEGILLTANIGIAFDWITIGFPTSSVRCLSACIGEIVSRSNWIVCAHRKQNLRKNKRCTGEAVWLV